MKLPEIFSCVFALFFPLRARLWGIARLMHTPLPPYSLSLSLSHSHRRDYGGGVCWQNFIAMDHAGWGTYVQQSPRAIPRNLRQGAAMAAIDIASGTGLIVAGGKES